MSGWCRGGLCPGQIDPPKTRKTVDRGDTRVAANMDQAAKMASLPLSSARIPAMLFPAPQQAPR